MSSKMAEIQRQLEQASGKLARAPAVEAPPATAQQVNTPRAVPPSREGKIHIGAYLHPDFKRSIRMVQAATGMDIQELLASALNDLFRAHNVPVIDSESQKNGQA